MKILLLEDDPSASELLSATLTAHRYAVDAIADGATGLDWASRCPYDLLIIDWQLPSMTGLEVCRRLRLQGSITPILMLTIRDSSDDIVAGLDAGADDFLTKGCDAAQLLARVRALLRRSDRTTPPVLCWGDLRLDPALTQVTYGQRPIACRPKEYELLELFLRHPQRLLTRSAIIDHLWPMADTPVEGSITNLIKDLRQRLRGAGMVLDPIETVYGLGYRLKTEPAPCPPVTVGLGAAAEPGPAPAVISAVEATPESAHPQASPRLDLAVQQATQRFRSSLKDRLLVLEEVQRSLQAGTVSPQQQQLAWAEAHKLAGGLGLFGYTQAAAVAEDIEQLLQLSQPSPLLAQRLEELKRSLTMPLG